MPVPVSSDTRAPLPVLLFASQKAWEAWLRKNHNSAPGVWVRIAKKNAVVASVRYFEAVESALCYGWIDGQAQKYDDATYMQRFTPRKPKSVWSKINKEKAGELIAAGRMQPAGLKAIEAAKQCGAWEKAYEGQSTAAVPPDLQAALDASVEAKQFFAALNSVNRYAILHRIHIVKRPDTRAKKIREYIEMLERGETLHPQRK